MAVCDCGTTIEPFKGGHPGDVLIPSHLEPGGLPCRASQTPFRALQRQGAGSQAHAAPTGSGASQVLLKPIPGRQFLKAASPEENILLWMDLVEKQTGKPFILDGDLASVVEETGETVEARHRGDLPEVLDGLCDNYVATLVAEELIKREWTSTSFGPQVEASWSSLSITEICAISNGRLANYVRKPRTQERALKALVGSLSCRAAIRREIAALGAGWISSMDKVLDILDGRLAAGYVMNDKGSALKKVDQA